MAENERAQPDPKAWVECAECHRAWVLRRAFVAPGLDLSAGRWEWLWMRDCKHREGRVVGPDPGADMRKAV